MALLPLSLIVAAFCLGLEPGIRPGGRVTFFCVAKESNQRKATPLSASPALRSGATCGARASGLPQNSRRSLRSLCSDSCGKSDHEACLSFGRHAAGCTALLGAARGGGEPLGPLLRSADRTANNQKPKYAPRRVGVQSPLRVPRSAGAPAARLPKDRRASTSDLPQLSEQRERSERSEFCGRPATRAPQVARSEAEGHAQWGRLFFAYFLLAKQKKVSRPPGRIPGSGLGIVATHHQAPSALTPTLSRREREQDWRSRPILCAALRPHKRSARSIRSRGTAPGG